MLYFPELNMNPSFMTCFSSFSTLFPNLKWTSHSRPTASALCKWTLLFCEIIPSQFLFVTAACVLSLLAAVISCIVRYPTPPPQLNVLLKKSACAVLQKEKTLVRCWTCGWYWSIVLVLRAIYKTQSRVYFRFAGSRVLWGNPVSSINMELVKM